MQRWEMAPYIEAIDSQLSSYFIVQGIKEPSPGVADRIPFCYGIYIPTVSALRKEYGELCVHCGLIGEAVKIFEDLELWDNLIFCYRFIHLQVYNMCMKKFRANHITYLKKFCRCSLGDITNDDACFEKALEVSNDRSAQAKRSLARSAYNRGQYRTSKLLWESAMALNSLYPDGWFALGAAALKDRDIEKALDGFTGAVQLDPENGEARNNIACLHMIKGKSKEAFIAFREALKFKLVPSPLIKLRNSYQLWENYSQVALDVGNVAQSSAFLQRTARKVLDLTNNKRIDAELLERIMTEVESMASPTNSSMTDDEDNFLVSGTTNAASEVGKSREAEHLVEFLGKVIQQITLATDVMVFSVRPLNVQRSLVKASQIIPECYNHMEYFQGSDLWKDRDQFKKFVKSSLELCKVYMEISSSTGSRDELLSADRHLWNIMKQARLGISES
ncbi:putative tetratricopeptide-like helical domain-containing protein [Rosa chinensis]|uniref:Putative tetratricopeptide-like helical domain-containing protein n=1 Tax=Rosa chinensis TaxID=74649 RepID=A0A2P6S8M2_ROSCH|nr:putative tetratricopeptide-like helical domain-containing protein [Rosa chinensis]